MSEDDDFKFTDDEEKIKPIDHDGPASKDGRPGTGNFMDKIATYMAQSGDKAKPALDETVDPVLKQQAKEEKDEEERKERIRQKDASVPEHMMDLVRDVDLENQVGKGQMVDLLSKVPSLRSVMVGAGWSIKSLEQPLDIDLSIFLLNRNDVTRQDSDFIYYNQMTGCEGAVQHEGDNRTGAGEGDEETATIDLNGIPFDIVKIMITFSVYDEAEVGEHLGMVRNMYLRLVNKEYNEEICRFVLDDEYQGSTGIYVAALVREGPRWYFQTIGTPVGRGGLPNIATRYGIIVKELQSTG